MLAAAVSGYWLQQQLLQAAALAGQPSLLSAALTESWWVLVALGAALWGWRAGAQPAGVLAWSGSQWRWQTPAGDSHAVSVKVMVDLGGWLLLLCRPLSGQHVGALSRLRPSAGAAASTAAGPGWISLSGPQDPHHLEAAPWAAFRAAVYFRAARPPGLNELGKPFF